MIGSKGTGPLEPAPFPEAQDAPWCPCKPALVLAPGAPIELAHEVGCPLGSESYRPERLALSAGTAGGATDGP